MKGLTPKEELVLDELARDGATNAEIGRRLNMSDKTVKLHIGHMLRHTAQGNRTALALWYLRQGVQACENENGGHYCHWLLLGEDADEEPDRCPETLLGAPCERNVGHKGQHLAHPRTEQLGGTVQWSSPEQR